MKFSEQWLRQWVNPTLSTDQLAQRLTLSGLEVDSVEKVAADFSDIVIGHVIEVQKHPDADRLSVCKVDIGEGEALQIVCGAANVAKDQKVPVAKINAVLPGNYKIKKGKLRGVESFGMICSETELGLEESSEGIMVLSQDAPVGVDIREYLSLNDHIFDIELTANRGDCLSIQGMAREVAAITSTPLSPPPMKTVTPSVAEQLPIKITAKEACPHYIGRVIRQIDPSAQTPFEMQQKLIRSGVRPINPIVDITNFVMLELGQPLHAFDYALVQQGIDVRFANEGEVIDLLDDQQLKLSRDDLVIASSNKPVALAGVKGGSHSGISDKTKDIFLESALFAHGVITKTARHYGIFTESSHRFERGVDFELQKIAIERATDLILEITGGEAGELVEHGTTPASKPAINIRRMRIEKILGIKLADDVIENIFRKLSMTLTESVEGWLVTVPSYRQDLNSEIDLIEEVARIYGYDNIPARKMTEDLQFLPAYETKIDLNRLRAVLVDNGYQEAITYSFVNPEYEKKLILQQHPLKLLNPISTELSIMRTNHWPGLIEAYRYNIHRQQPRIRLFEIGLCFLNEHNGLKQQLRLGGLCAGPLYTEQWGESKRTSDFYDVKGDVERLLAAAGRTDAHFEPYEHPALHPGQSAAIVSEQRIIGLLGALHPSVAQELDINQSLYLFDLDLDSIMDMSLPKYEMFSKFPAIKRDMALVVAADVHAEKLRQKILASGGELLKNVQIFDIYQGKGIESGKKSIALSLIFQHLSRTLVDAEINESMQNIVAILHKDFNATLRD